MILLYVYQYFHTAVHMVEKALFFKGSSTYFLHQNHLVCLLKHTFLDLLSEFLIQEIWGGSCVCIFQFPDDADAVSLGTTLIIISL